MKCPNCRNEVPSGSRFCLHCGAPIEAAKPPPAFDEEARTTLAPPVLESPSPVSIPTGMQNCPHCGKMVPLGKRFCGYCGAALTAQARSKLVIDEEALTSLAPQNSILSQAKSNSETFSKAIQPPAQGISSLADKQSYIKDTVRRRFPILLFSLVAVSIVVSLVAFMVYNLYHPPFSMNETEYVVESANFLFPATPKATTTPTLTPTKYLTATQSQASPRSSRTPTPTIEIIIFKDDFEDPDPNWHVYDNEYGHCYITNGQYHLVQKIKGAMNYEDVPDTKDISSFVLSFDVTFLEGWDSWFGAAFRAELGSGDSYIFSISNNGRYKLSGWKDSKRFELVPEIESDAILTGSQTNHIEIEAIGSVIKIRVNKALLIDVTDNQIDSGEITLYLKGAMGYVSHVYFDNIIITSPGKE